MAPTYSKKSLTTSDRSSEFTWRPASDSLLFESCERRLVLSAQLLFDVLGDQALDHHEAGTSTPTAPPLEYHLQEAHAATGLNAVRAEYGLAGAGQTVAVIDSGIAWDHVALGQGYGPGYRVVGGWDFTEENDNQPYDDGPAGFHGTHVSGIIASDDPAQPGVAPDVDLVALRVFNDLGEGRLEWIESALQWVQQHQRDFENPITTVNISIGTSWNADVLPEWATLEDELQQLRADGILVTASAGNSFQELNNLGLSYPASSPYVLPVASVDSDGQLSDFSQRNQSILAAPGSNIISTIPDHVLGRDGVVNDFSAASGTSMAAPYVAGASVLVRQAMEMTGWESINADTITAHLHATADSVFDTLTGLSYDRLNLDQAIDALIPDDTVGDTGASATTIDLFQPQLDTWVNSLSDTDVFRFDASASGLLTLDASSQWLDSVHWQILAQGQSVAEGQLEPGSLSVVAGQSYELYVSSDSSIGPVSFDLAFEETLGSGEGSEPNSGSGLPHAVTADLGTVRYAEHTLGAGTGYSVEASQDGVFTVQWTHHSANQGSLFVTDASGQVHGNSAWNEDTVRLDLPVMAGDVLNISIPGTTLDQGQLVMANVLTQSGSTATITGTLAADQLSLDLQDGVVVGFNAVEYEFASSSLDTLHLNGYGSNDRLDATGSQRLDKVDLRPTGSTIENDDIQVVIASVEEVSYTSGGGADRVYLYDSDTDDALTARPGSAELIGVGYRFEVEQVERIFIHATGGGQDIAYLYDSVGNDRLSLRPQFSSMSGEGFFNYVRGFERVHAYANAGGVDTAELHDSAGNDRFFTSGVSASMVGPGFSSFTRGFEQVNAQASAGGHDMADLYGSNAQTEWRQGSDFISFHEGDWQREARGFNDIGTFIDGQSTAIATSTSNNAVAGRAQVIAQLQPQSPLVDHAPSPALTEEMAPEATSSNRPILDGSSGAIPHQAVPDILSAGAAPPVAFPSSTWEASTWQSADLRHASGLVDTVDGQLTHDTVPAPAAEAPRMWETVSMPDALANKLHLPEETLMADESLERNVLDEAFRQFEALFR